MRDRWLVIAVGTEHGEDAAALRVLDHLAASGVRTAATASPGTDLLPLLRGEEAAVIVDAIRTGAIPGTLRVLGRDELALFDAPISSHGLGVGETLALGDAMGELPPRLELVGVEAGMFDPAVAARALVELLHELRA